MLKHVVGIVSGGSSGLGAAATRHIIRHGGKVVVADLGTSKDRFFEMASSVGIDSSQINSANGGTIYTCVSGDENGNVGPVLAFSETDVTISNQVAAALDVAEHLFGESVNAAISCAGIAPAKKTLSKDRNAPGFSDGQSETSWKAHPVDIFSRALDVNVVGTFNLARLSAERMMKREVGVTTAGASATGDDVDLSMNSLRGCIINTASIAAFEGQVGQVAYAASKGAIVGMTLPMARDLAPHGIRVMTIVSRGKITFPISSVRYGRVVCAYGYCSCRK
jgi:3-hydroxyacyl-CoA dehydrogenase/3-hydroxy-2-methylbutyryl-CoA dehydrogenase